jgi:hypothetical protein
MAKYRQQTGGGAAAEGGGPQPVTSGGDSLGAHLRRRGGAAGQESGTVGRYRRGDTAVSGWNPKQILDNLIPNLPREMIEGKNVAWSTGVSNTPDSAAALAAVEEDVPKQIAALKAQHAKNIILMGVGTAKKLQGVNEALARIAQKYGVLFAGAQRKTGGDLIHSTDQAAEMAAVQQALKGATIPQSRLGSEPIPAFETGRAGALGGSGAGADPGRRSDAAPVKQEITFNLAGVQDQHGTAEAMLRQFRRKEQMFLRNNRTAVV